VPSDRPREPQEGGGEEGLTRRITRGRAGARGGLEGNRLPATFLAAIRISVTRRKHSSALHCMPNTTPREPWLSGNRRHTSEGR
jgi:hypothetical protein